jgi:hypothetical protein
MSTVRTLDEQVVTTSSTGTKSRAWHLSDVLLPLSVTLWAVGVARTNTATLGSYGLITAVPIIFYVGLALLLISAGAEIGHGQLSRWRMSAHLVALVLMLYGTAPLVYPEARYAWLYRTVGVVQYVNAHGTLNPHIDIFQNWPGFFAFAAWFSKVAGVASPLAYAKWTQLVAELAALPLINDIYKALALPIRQRWVALMIYPAANWIGQDYFSPQALGTLLSLGIMALVVRWMYAGNFTGASARRSPSGPSVLLTATLICVFFVLSFTHELSPYILLAQLGALAVIGFCRPRWIVLPLAAVALGYFAPRFTFVNSHFGLVASIGSFFRNVSPPSAVYTGYTAPASVMVIRRCADALTVLIWGLSLIGAWQLRRSRRTVITLVALAYSPVAVLATVSYGNEGILRVFLFSLPWSAALAAAVLAPERGDIARTGQSISVTSHSKWARFRRPVGVYRIPIVLSVIGGLFLVAFYGSDQSNVISRTEVTTVTSFFAKAPGGPIMAAEPSGPLSDTARYDQFPVAVIFGAPAAAWGTTPAKPNIAQELASVADLYTHGLTPAYTIITPSMIAYAAAAGEPVNDLAVLEYSLARSREWHLVVSNAGTLIYERPAGRVGRIVSGARHLTSFGVP